MSRLTPGRSGGGLFRKSHVCTKRAFSLWWLVGRGSTSARCYTGYGPVLPPTTFFAGNSKKKYGSGEGNQCIRNWGRVDPVTARRLHPRDTVKVLRALEVYRQTGTPLSKAHEKHGQEKTPFRALVLGLTMERAALYQRIDQRVDAELAKGLVEETRILLAKGYARGLVSMKSLGYRQMAGYLEGEYSFAEAVRRLKRDTRHFAKRQMTWFRKEPNLAWVEVHPDESVPSVAQHILSLIERFVHTLRA